MKRNGFASIIVVIIIAAALAFGGWYVLKGHVTSDKGQGLTAPQATTVSQVDTADWKTYRNEQHRFDLLYPENWTYRNAWYENGVVEFFPKSAWKGPDTPDVHQSYDNPGYFGVLVYPNPKRLSLENLLNESPRYLSRAEAAVASKKAEMGNGPTYENKDIILRGITGLDQLSVGEGGSSRTIFLLADRRMFIISFGTIFAVDDPRVKPLYNTFSEVLSTFRFTE